MVDSWAPHHVVAWAGHGLTAAGNLHVKLTGDEHHQRGPLVVRRPLGTLVTHRMVGPLDFYVLRGADTLRRVDEVADQPAAGVGRVLVGVAGGPTVAHWLISHSISGSFTRSPPISARRRSPCVMANNPSLLHATSPNNSVTSSASVVEY